MRPSRTLALPALGASFDCQIRFHAGCTTLSLRYADGQIARLYEAPGDAQQWREYDVWSGVLKSMGPAEAGQVDAAIARGAAVRLGTEEPRAPSVQ
jgi:hypothetical protein